jgi:hypothetical protein
MTVPLQKKISGALADDAMNDEILRPGPDVDDHVTEHDLSSIYREDRQHVTVGDEGNHTPSWGSESERYSFVQKGLNELEKSRAGDGPLAALH